MPPGGLFHGVFFYRRVNSAVICRLLSVDAFLSSCVTRHRIWFDYVLLSESRSTSARHGEAKSDGKSHHRSGLSQSSSHKDHRDELSSSSGSLAKQVCISSYFSVLVQLWCMFVVVYTVDDDDNHNISFFIPLGPRYVISETFFLASSLCIVLKTVLAVCSTVTSVWTAAPERQPLRVMGVGFYRPVVLSDAQPTVLVHWRQLKALMAIREDNPLYIILYWFSNSCTHISMIHLSDYKKSTGGC